ncbi:MAG: DUF2283 domain-containing protein [Patescibacteria group bacterium]
MKVTYDSLADAAYIYFDSPDKKVARTLKVNDYLLIDLGKKGEIFGIEILDASQHVAIKELLKKPSVKKLC